MKEHKCITGMWSNFSNSTLITEDELMENIEFKKSLIRPYTDGRYSTNFFLFQYCPICGSKIPWKEIREKGESYHV